MTDGEIEHGRLNLAEASWEELFQQHFFAHNSDVFSR